MKNIEKDLEEKVFFSIKINCKESLELFYNCYSKYITSIGKKENKDIAKKVRQFYIGLRLNKLIYGEEDDNNSITNSINNTNHNIY